MINCISITTASLKAFFLHTEEKSIGLIPFTHNRKECFSMRAEPICPKKLMLPGPGRLPIFPHICPRDGFCPSWGGGCSPHPFCYFCYPVYLNLLQIIPDAFCTISTVPSYNVLPRFNLNRFSGW